MSKKRIEDVIGEALEEDERKSALDLVAYLRANEMELPLGELKTFIWEVKYKNELVCFFELTDEYWGIMSDQVPGTWITWSDGEDSGEYVDSPVDERTKEIVWANLRFHDLTCHGKCSPGRRKRVLGKEFDNLCASALAFYGSDFETLSCMKKMIGARKNDILKQI